MKAKENSDILRALRPSTHSLIRPHSDDDIIAVFQRDLITRSSYAGPERTVIWLNANYYKGLEQKSAPARETRAGAL